MKLSILICFTTASLISSSLGSFDNFTTARYADRFTNSVRVLEKLSPSKSLRVEPMSPSDEKDLLVANSFGLGHYSRHHFGGFGGYPGHYGHGHHHHHHRFFNPYYGVPYSYGGYFRHHHHQFQGYYGHHHHHGHGFAGYGYGYPGFGINHF